MSELYFKFRPVLKQALIEKRVSFPDDMEVEFEPFDALRGLRRKKDNYSDITINDFLSHVESDYKATRLSKVQINNGDITFYSCSLFRDKEELGTALDCEFPSGRWKMGKGIININAGTVQRSKYNSHVNLWIYSDYNISGGFQYYE